MANKSASPQAAVSLRTGGDRRGGRRVGPDGCEGRFTCASGTAADGVPWPVTTLRGVHCGKDNPATGVTSSYAIEVAANDVVIDVNGYKLGGLAGGDGTGASGIYAGKRKSITIRNGNLRGSLPRNRC